jgi:hypothetical protein
LFIGGVPLTGRLAGDETVLAPTATRCSNCHSSGDAPAASTSGPSFGPTLSTRTLRQETARRGGPPSIYDEASFCRAVTTGVDPAYVVIRREMPRYDLPASDCKAMWLYLVGPAR